MFVYRIYQFFSKHLFLLALLILLSVAATSYFALKIKVEEDITRFIPKDKKVNNINDILNSLKIKDKLVINIYNADSTVVNPESIKITADALADTLLAKFGKEYIKEIKYKIADDNVANLYQTFYNYLPVFLEEKDYTQIEKNIQADSIKQILQNDYKTLLSPTGMVFGKFIKKDPLNIVPLVLKKLKGLQYDENFDLNEGYIFTKNNKNLLFLITPSIPSNDYKANKKFLSFLDSIIPVLEVKNQVKIEYFGTAAVSLANSEQIKKDSILTSTVALIAIALILILYFKRILIIVFILLPVAFGAIFSLALIYLLKGEVSAIALGAGSIVLGIAINYSLHFFTHFKHEQSVERVLKDLTAPMLLGCTTTVAAFLALQFAKSEAMHDFGLFAGCSLIGAVLFSIIVLPHLLKKDKKQKDNSAESKSVWMEKIISYQLHKNKIVLIVFGLLTLLFTYTAHNVSFESDMMKVNYQPEKLVLAEQHLNALNKFSLRSVYVISNGSNANEALKAHEQAVAKLQQLKENNVVAKYSSVTSLLVSDSLQKIRIDRWDKFWALHKDSVKKNLIVYGTQLKFNENAFSSFYDLIDKKFIPVNLLQNNTLRSLVDDWITEKNNKAAIISLLKVPEEIKLKVYDAFADSPHTIVFDRQYLTTKYVEVISSDFNTILIITGLLVFGFMLLSHGRIELALINFLPMFITWIWILGIMGILGLKFNIINIIISTFIFGLGDDYSIFIMDGLSHEYKYGRKNLDSYKSSIFLSALITTIGFGVLLFAKHPALKSIAAITIIGMVAVVFISFIVQPMLYNALILNRVKRKLPPVTATNFFLIWLGFSVFFLGSFVVRWGGSLIFAMYPGNKSKRRFAFHKLFMNMCKFIIYFFANVKKRIINNHNEDFSKPAIIVCNHQSYIDLALLPTLTPKMNLFTKMSVWNSFLFGKIVRLADFYPSDLGFEQSIEQVREKMKNGYSVLIFPEGTRSTTGEILRFHKGAFSLAEQLQADIIPIVLHGADYCLPKNDFYYRESTLTLKVLDRISPTDDLVKGGYQEASKNICKLMRNEFQIIKKDVETTRFYRAELIRNYIYKGPVLEWYCRIKTKLENNYQQFEDLIPKKGKIVDIGCGYGFLSIMLNLMSKDREILGVDYDDEKIAIANNCLSKSDRLNFVCADVTTYEFQKADAFIINDVLHYFSTEKQIQLVETCIKQLNANGILIIRDADASMQKQHRFTKLTEFFSTKFGFNKTTHVKLHFFTSSLIIDIVNKFPNLSYQKISDSSITSNNIFVITNNSNNEQ
jgi:1-acyl-sn-glycerol-3-phosphate acyltransferase